MALTWHLNLLYIVWDPGFYWDTSFVTIQKQSFGVQMTIFVMLLVAYQILTYFSFSEPRSNVPKNRADQILDYLPLSTNFNLRSRSANVG